MNKIITLFYSTFLMISNLIAAPLSGTYTIGTGKNYSTLDSALMDLQTEGASGDITFSISPGTYTANSTLDQVVGLSNGDTNSLLITSSTSNASDVILEPSTNGRLFILKSMNNVSFTHITFNQIKAGYALLLDGSLNTILKHCIINGYNTTATSAGHSAIYTTGTRFTTLDSCQINKGSYSIYCKSNDSSLTISSCNFSASQSGVSPYLVKNFMFHDNVMDSTNLRGISPNQTKNMTIYNNKIMAKGFSSFAFCSTIDTGRNLMYNNFFYNKSGITISLSSSNSDLEFYHNTIISETNLPLYHIGTRNTITFQNNLVSSLACSPVSYAVISSQIPKGIYERNAYSNVNPDTCENFYFLGSKTFEQYQKESKKDLLSAFSTASFIDAYNNPIPKNGIFNNICLPITGINKDINGNERDSTNPDPGAFEFDAFYNNDISISSLASPLSPNCRNSDTIKLKVKNVGKNSISSFSIDYWLNGVKSTVTFNENLDMQESSIVKLGIGNFDGWNDSLTAAIVKVNGGLDGDSSNNKLKLQRLYSPLTGVVYLGSMDTLSNLDSVLTQLEYGGICGDVSLLISKGTYTGTNEFVIPSYKKANPTDLLTIAGETGDPKDVVLKMKPLMAKGVLNIEFNDNIAIRNLTLDANGVVNNCNSALFLGKESSHISLSNLICNGNSDRCESIIEVSDNKYVESIVIDSCTFKDGVMVFESSDMGETKNTIQFTHNKVTDVYVVLGLSDFHKSDISNNEINSTLDGTYAYTFVEVTNSNFTNNSIKLYGEGSLGLEFYNTDNSDSTRTTVANNFIYLPNEKSNGAIYLDDNTNLDFVNNTIVANCNQNYSSTLNFEYKPLTKFKNNIVVNTHPNGELVYFDGDDVIDMDYNNLYGKNILVGHDGDEFYNLADWQNKLQLDSNSIEVEPMFYDTNDYHVCNPILNNAGASLTESSLDLDGEVRNIQSPDIGADEFTPISQANVLQDSLVNLCMGDSILLKSAFDGASYTWSFTSENEPEVYAKTAGKHFLTITDACGTNMDSIVVIEKSLPIASFTKDTSGLIATFNNTSTNGGLMNTYYWNFGDLSTSDSTNPIKTYSIEGTYPVTLIANNSCGQDSITENVTVNRNSSITSIPDVKIHYYPNPTKGMVYLSFENIYQDIRLSVFNALGKKVDEIRFNNKKMLAFDLNQPAGIYFIQFTLDGKRTSEVKLLKL